MAINELSSVEGKVVGFECTDNDALKFFRAVYNHMQLIKKFTKWEKEANPTFGFVKGLFFNFEESLSPIPAVLQTHDHPLFKRIPYFILNSTEFFEFEKFVRPNYMSWQAGTLTFKDTKHPDGVKTYRSSTTGNFITSKYKKFQRVLAKFKEADDCIAMTSFSEQDVNPKAIFVDDLMNRIRNFCEAYPSPRICFTEDDVICMEDILSSTNEIIQFGEFMEKYKVKTFLQIPKKYLYKISEKDNGFIEFRRINAERYICKISVMTKKYTANEYIECIVP
jgi:hypothetical protein